MMASRYNLQRTSLWAVTRLAAHFPAATGEAFSLAATDSGPESSTQKPASEDLSFVLMLYYRRLSLSGQYAAAVRHLAVAALRWGVAYQPRCVDPVSWQAHPALVLCLFNCVSPAANCVMHLNCICTAAASLCSRGCRAPGNLRLLQVCSTAH